MGQRVSLMGLGAGLRAILWGWGGSEGHSMGLEVPLWVRRTHLWGQHVSHRAGDLAMGLEVPLWGRGSPFPLPAPQLMGPPHRYVRDQTV